MKACPRMRVRPVAPGDIAALAPRLREADIREIEAATGEPPLEALERCAQASDPCYVVAMGPEATGEVIALFGVVPAEPDRGVVWLVGSDEIARHGVAFARDSRAWVARLHQRYRILGNCADVRNEVHLRWLGWCGFTIHRKIEEYGAGRRPFYEFSSVHAVDGSRGAARAREC